MARKRIHTTRRWLAWSVLFALVLLLTSLSHTLVTAAMGRLEDPRSTSTVDSPHALTHALGAWVEPAQMTCISPHC